MLSGFIVAIFALYFLLFGVDIPNMRKMIEEYIAELEKTEPSKKVGLKVLQWYNLLLEENSKGHYSAFLTPQEFEIVRDFLYECGIMQMPAPEFRRRQGEFSRIFSKTIGSIFSLLRIALFIFVLFFLGKQLLINQPSDIGLFKMWAFILLMPLACALVTKGIKFIQAADN